MNATRLTAGTTPEASATAQSAAQPSAIATCRSWCSPFEAKKPPVAVPAALPSRYAVRPVVANASVTP